MQKNTHSGMSSRPALRAKREGNRAGIKKSWAQTFVRACTGLSPVVTLLAVATPLSSLHLPTAHHTAAQQRPLLKAHEQTINARKAAESAAFAGYLPQLGATNSSVFEAEKGVDTTVHTIKLSGSQLIFDMAGPLAKASIAKQATKHAQHTYRAATHATQEAVTTAFLDAWLAQEKEAYITVLTKASQRIVARAHAAHRLQATNTHTHAGALSLDAKQQAAVASYPHEIQRTRRALYSLLHQSDDQATLHYAPLQPAPLQAERYYQELAQQHRPELKANQATEEQYALQRSASNAQYLPKISVTGSLSKTYGGNTSLRGTDSLIGLHATWSFFDGLTNYHQAHEAEANRLRTTFERQELYNTITRQVSTAYHLLQEKMHELEAANAAFDEQAGRWVRAQHKYRLSALRNDAFLAQQVTYEAAAHALRAAQVAVRKQEETLAYHCGYPASWATPQPPEQKASL